MKKNIFQTIKLGMLGAGIAMLASYAHAAVWSPAPGTPLSGNTETPVTVSAFNEIKTGGLSVYGFVANQPAQFGGTTFLTGQVSGDSTKSIRFGTAARPTDLSLSGEYHTGQLMQSNTLAGQGDNMPVCTNKTGVVVICE